MDIAEKEAYGITQKSTEFVRAHQSDIGAIVQIECLLAGNTQADLGKEQWVAFADKDGNRIVVSGFSWGYTGEGPHGLLNMARELGFDIDSDAIARYPQQEYWAMHREPLQLTQEIAEYIISLQSVYDAEVGLGKDDYALRDKLELEYPLIKQDRLNHEFNNWLWSVRTEQEPDVAEARQLMGFDIPFDDVYHADDPDKPNSTYQLYRQHTEIAGELFRLTKSLADQRLIAQDKAGEINLRHEWKTHKEHNCKLPNEGDDKDES